VYKRIIGLLNFNNILTEEQFRVRKGLSDNALHRFIDDILYYLNDKMHSDGIFCDLAKSFDCVNLDILLSKVNFHGIQDKAGQ
jgi:hypothetical protein